MNRRSFLQTSAIFGSGIFLSNDLLALSSQPNSKFGGVQVGVITYSFRSMPGSAEQILQYCLQSGVSAIELMGDAAEVFAGCPTNITDKKLRSEKMRAWRESVSMDKFVELRKMFKKAGVSIYAFKPDALGMNNSDGEIEYALKAAKALGATSVNQVTEKVVNLINTTVDQNFLTNTVKEMRAAQIITISTNNSSSTKNISQYSAFNIALEQVTSQDVLARAMSEEIFAQIAQLTQQQNTLSDVGEVVFAATVDFTEAINSSVGKVMIFSIGILVIIVLFIVVYSVYRFFKKVTLSAEKLSKKVELQRSNLSTWEQF